MDKIKDTIILADHRLISDSKTREWAYMVIIAVYDFYKEIRVALNKLIAELNRESFGTATLSSGTATVNTSAVTADSQILLTAQDNSSTGALRVSARTAGTSFVITSSNGADSGLVAWRMRNP